MRMSRMQRGCWEFVTVGKML